MSTFKTLFTENSILKFPINRNVLQPASFSLIFKGNFLSKQANYYNLLFCVYAKMDFCLSLKVFFITTHYWKLCIFKKTFTQFLQFILKLLKSHDFSNKEREEKK